MKKLNITNFTCKDRTTEAKPLPNMTIVFIIISIFLCCCSIKKYQSNYVLIKKYPLELPDMSISILNDSCGEISQNGEDNKISFDFYKKRNYIIINDISYVDNIISLNKGDTIICFKKELYLFNAKNKLVFKRE